MCTKFEMSNMGPYSPSLPNPVLPFSNSIFPFHSDVVLKK